MSRLDDLQRQVTSLTPDELNAFRNWLTGFDAGIWDAQLAADSENGKLRSLTDRALRDHAAGRSSRL